jgi:hypothetical protein
MNNLALQAVSAYDEGFRNGQIDTKRGYRSDYAYYGANDTNTYTREYSKGYRAAFTEAARLAARVEQSHVRNSFTS